MLVCGAQTLGFEPPYPDATFVAETRSYLDRLERLGLAGVVVISDRGAPILVQGYGLADRENGVRWSPGTVSTVGSITKQFTAAAILVLEQEGPSTTIVTARSTRTDPTISTATDWLP